MRCSRLGLFGLTLFSLTLLVACGGDDSGGPVAPQPTVPMSEALEGYWDAQTDISATMTQMNQTWDAIEAALNSKSSSDQDIDTLVNQYVTQSLAAADHYDQLIELENSITAYGDKGLFSDTAKAVVVGVYTVSKKVVVSTGQQLRTGWRVLSGQKTLREALADPDSGIPIVSDMAKRLKEHNEQRDNAITEAIANSDSHEGAVPYTELEGSTPAQRIEAYRNLPDNHPLKKDMRGRVHHWHTGEKAATVVTLKKTAQDQIKNYVGAVSGSDELVEIGDQMTNPTQAPTDKGTLTSSLRDADTAALVNAAKTMIIVKRDQPEHEQKIAVVQGVDPDFSAALPSGNYDVIVMAEEYIRAAAADVVITAGAVQNALLDLYDRVTNSLILESLSADASVVAEGQNVALTALAASTINQALTFAWDVSGPSDATVSGAGPVATFNADTAGDYLVTLTVSDAVGNQKQKSVAIEVVGGSVELTDIEIGDGAIVDGKINPGEQVVVTLTMTNPGDVDITGSATIQSPAAVTIVSSASQAVSLAAGASTTWPVTLQLPVDYSRNEVRLAWSCAMAEVTVDQDIVLPVDFWVHINDIASPVTDRALTVSGQVANPALTSAYLVVDGEADQVFDVTLDAGSFSQTIVLKGASGSRPVSVVLTADSGTWREEDTETFTADIPAAGFRVTLTWDTSGTDVDLWVTDPSGIKCYYDNDQTASGLYLDVDNTDGFGPENITNQSPPPGAYLVQVHYYDDNNDDEAVGSGCQIVVRLNEGTEDEEVRTYSGYLSDTDDVWTVATLTIGDKQGDSIVLDGRTEKFDGALPEK